jgi:hypothetical protein
MKAITQYFGKLNLIIAISLLALLECSLSFAQAPQKMSYQAVIRSNTNQLVTNKMVGMRISILQGSESGTAVYTETQKPTTNSNGLVSIEIGGGSGFEAIDWANGLYFIKTETDPSGGTNYNINGVSQLLSVPFALFAKNVENVDDADADSTNEIQLLSKSGSVITLSKSGGSVSIDDADADPTNEIQVLSKTGNTVSLSRSGGSFTDAVDDADADPVNEIQILSLINNNLTLSKGGGTVPLPTPEGGDNWGTQTAATNTTLEGNGTTGIPLKIAQQNASNGQVLKWNGETWIPGNDNTGESGLTLPYSHTVADAGYAFSVTNTSSSAIKGEAKSEVGSTIGIYGRVNSPSGYGIYGLSTSTTGLTYGVYGSTQSSSGVGLLGIALSETGWNVGVKGTSNSNSGIGVFGSARHGVYGETNSTTGGYGIWGVAIASSGNSIGVFGASNSFEGTGVYGSAQKFAVCGEASSTVGYGVIGRATSATGLTVGVYGQAFSPSGFAGYFAGRLVAMGKLGIGTIDPNYTLDVAGSVNINKGISSGAALYCNGDQALWYNGTYFSWGYDGTYNFFNDAVTIGTSVSPGYKLVVYGTAAKTGGGSWSSTSDIRLKNLSGKYEKGLKEIVALEAVKFFYKKGNPRELPSDEEQIGFVAQDVQKVFPEAVTEAADGYLDFNIHAINVALVNAVKEMKAENDKLKAENQLLKSKDEQIDSRLANLEKIIATSAMK